jgi:hypothetical protein
MCLEWEVTTIDEFDFSVWNVPLECFGTCGDENGVVLTPDGENWWFIFTEVFLEVWVKGFVGSVVIEYLKLILGFDSDFYLDAAGVE